MSPAVAPAAVLGAGWLFPQDGAPLPPLLAGEKPDRLCRLSMQAVSAAFRQTLLQGPSDWDRDRVSVILGSAQGCHATDEAYYRGVLAAGAEPILGASPRLFAYTLPSSPVGEISIHFGFRGPAMAMVHGTTSGLSALGEGLRAVRRNNPAPAVIVAADVASQWVSGPEEEVHDGAAAILLVPAGLAPDPCGQVVAVCSTFCAGRPEVALRQCVERVLLAHGSGREAGVLALCDPQSEKIARDAQIPVSLCVDREIYPPGRGAAGALGAVARVGMYLDRGTSVALVLSCDGHGHAAAALCSSAIISR